MTKRSLTKPCVLVTLTLVLCLNGAAQKGNRTEKARAGASVEMSLDRLEQELKESVTLDFRMRYPRRTYVRLKRRGGCDITFQVSQVPGSAYVNESSQPGASLSSAEWRVSLSDLDADGVEMDRPEKGDYRVMRFATLGGREAIKLKGFGTGDVRWVREGRIDISEKAAPQVATALRQAIGACRE
jgi:hypothetical protein